MSGHQMILEHLKRLGACYEAREWIQGFPDVTWQALWDRCNSPAWMGWLLHRLASKRKIGRAKVTACFREIVQPLAAFRYADLHAVRFGLEFAVGYTQGQKHCLTGTDWHAAHAIQVFFGSQLPKGEMRGWCCGRPGGDSFMHHAHLALGGTSAVRQQMLEIIRKHFPVAPNLEL